jgi:menaquinone-9 beta-reductase
MQTNRFDVIIIGGGPAGSSCAIKLANTGLNVALLDKSRFPRDKTCGDGLSIDVVNQLTLLSPGLAEQFNTFAEKNQANGIRLFSPNTNFIDIPFYYKKEKSSGYVSRRYHFDNLLFQHAKNCENVTTLEDCTVNDVINEGTHVTVKTSTGDFQTSMVIGADGAHSIVAKKLGNIAVDKEHYCAGLRMYYEGLPAFNEHNFIELYFFKDILPGYVWIFPLAGNKANVGITVLSSTVSKNKLNIKDLLQQYITNDPVLKERFKNAIPMETPKGYGLPLGSKKRNLSGERFLLLGDAAALIDPFSGEGIGNAIRSGRIAAAHVLHCFEKENFSAAFNKAYDKDIYRKMWKEFRISRTLQNVICHPWAFNFVIRQANRSKYLHKFLIDALADIDKKRTVLWKPGFYIRMLFK